MDTPEPVAPSLGLAAEPRELALAPGVEAAPASIRWGGHIATAGDNFVQYVNGQAEPPEAPKSPATRRVLRSLLALRDAGTALLQKNVLDRKRWRTREELRIAIITWIERTYHHRRRRQARLGRSTPIEYETIMNPTVSLAA